jgi:uncharacterized protein (DUF924 family)
MKTAAEILKFWFDDHGPDDWFAGKPEFDAEIAAGFSETHTALARGEGWDWRTTAAARLAEIIVLDQFSRQLFRDDRRAFASDGTALVLAQEAVGGGHHNFLPSNRRVFVLMPFMHAESLAVQLDSVRLFTALGIESNLKFAQAHADVIRRFGRFPARNAALGRVSTPEELEFLAAGKGMF